MLFGILDRYLGRAVLTTSLLVLTVLVVLASIFAFISELDEVGKGNYTAVVAAQYIFLTMPSKALLLFAPSVLLGSLLGLGALAGNSELTVMRAAGISNWRIIRAVMTSGLVLMLLVAVFGETLVPRAEQAAEELRLAALDKRLSATGGSGLWLKSGERFVQVRTVMPDYTLLGINVHRFENHSLHQSAHAARAVRTEAGWQLEDLVTTDISESVVTRRESEVLWRDFVADTDGVTPESVAPLVSPELLTSLSVSAESLSAVNLHQQVGYLRENGLDARATELAFWSKVFSPFSTLIMLMLSLPFVFASQRAGGTGQKIFIGIMLGIAYVLVNRLLTQLALANGFAPFLSAVLPLLLFVVIAVVGIRRTA